MIGSLRNFAKTKLAGLLVFIMIIPFVFWGMGGMFSSGNTNNLAKINKENISTEEFIEYLNNSGIPQDYIRENLDKPWDWTRVSDNPNITLDFVIKHRDKNVYKLEKHQIRLNNLGHPLHQMLRK